MKNARPQKTETSAGNRADSTKFQGTDNSRRFRAIASKSVDGTGGAEMKPPIVTGQCAQVLTLISEHQPLLSFVLTADHAIPEAAARVHELRCMGWNIITRITSQSEFRGRIRRNAALYSMGVPEWPSPGFVTGKKGGR